MRFEQYQILKQHALAACEAAGAKFPEVGQMNPIILAYVGDVVFSMYVRLRLLPTSGQVRVIHDLGSKWFLQFANVKLCRSYKNP